MKVYFKILQEIVTKNRRQTTICFSIMLAMSVLQVFIPLSMRDMISRIEEDRRRCGCLEFVLWFMRLCGLVTMGLM